MAFLEFQLLAPLLRIVPDASRVILIALLGAAAATANQEDFMKRTTSLFLVILLGSMLAGCGSSGGSSETIQPTQQQLQLTGPWHVQASDGNFIEFNANQTGSTISANQVAIINVKFNSSANSYTNATWRPQNCVPGPYSLTGTVDNTSSSVNFTVQETGGQITATSTMGTGPEAGVLKGTYNDPACNGSNVTFIATEAASLAGKYVNTCNFNPCGTADPSLTLQVAQDSSYHLTISGSDTKNGSFTLSGNAIGSTMWVSGMISGQNVSWYGWHYDARDANLQDIFIIDADTNAPVATVEGCINGTNCTLRPL